MENPIVSTEKDLQQAKLEFDRGESTRVVTGSGVFHKTKEAARIYSENNGKELVQVGDYWLAKNRTTTNPSVTVT